MASVLAHRRIIAMILAGLVVLAAIIGVGNAMDQTINGARVDTLNSLAWMQYGTVTTTDGIVLSFQGDYAAIRWFQDNVSGSPVVAEASIGAYRCNGSRFAINTGLPTVIGWRGHEEQQRPDDDFQRRTQDMFTLYTGTDLDQKRTIIDRYGIAYIVAGQLEWRYPLVDDAGSCTTHGNPDGMYAIRSMVGTDLEIAFAFGDTIVYRVL